MILLLNFINLCVNCAIISFFKVHNNNFNNNAVILLYLRKLMYYFFDRVEIY